MMQLCLLTLSLILCSVHQAASELYYITPNSTDHCRVRPCLTLYQFVTNSSHHLQSKTTLVFLPGTHYLEVSLTVSNVDSFVMKSESTPAQIHCTRNSHVTFYHLWYVHIDSLKFLGCGGNQAVGVQEFGVQYTVFKGQEYSETALELVQTTAEIVNSTFESNKRGSYDTTGDKTCGGAIIASDSSVDISQSKFEDNRADNGGAIFAGQNSIINVSGSEFVNNNANVTGGVLRSQSSTITIETCQFHENIAISGGVLFSYSSTMKLEQSKFHGNSAQQGGVVTSISDDITIEMCKFHRNYATSFGGVLVSEQSTTKLERSDFHGNSAQLGGVVLSVSDNITIEMSKFYGNNATEAGGVLHSNANLLHNNGKASCIDRNTITLKRSEFYGNSAGDGGVVSCVCSTITMEASTFDDNTAILKGGVLTSVDSTITTGNSAFINNTSTVGAVIFAIQNSKIQQHNSLQINNNLAVENAVILLHNSEFIGHDKGNVTFSNNQGSLVAFISDVTFRGDAMFKNNTPPNTTTQSGDIQEGGAITAFKSNIRFDGRFYCMHNQAENGGAIHSTESKLYVNGRVSIENNRATSNGGGVYLSSSELNCKPKSTLTLFNNTASHKGGAIHAVSSSINVIYNSTADGSRYICSHINFTKNLAKFGGGLSLETVAKLYILQYAETSRLVETNACTITFTANSAENGGAIYVNDDTNSATCTSSAESECFFQVLRMYYLFRNDGINHTMQAIGFSKNYANSSGATLYGGLLDRCAISQFAHGQNVYEDSGLSYFMYVSTPKYIIEHIADNPTEKYQKVKKITNISISSLPVKVCLCVKNQTDWQCTNRTSVDVKKGEVFPVSLVAVDQVGQPVNATIQTSLHYTESGLGEGQLATKIPAKCTNLKFNVNSPQNTETLTLHASNGSCNDERLSQAMIEIHFLPCSCLVGLQVEGVNKTNCTCKCHSDINEYVEQCDSQTGSFVKRHQSRAWISYINDTDLTGYIIYPNCPFDYCLSDSPPVDLNQPNGADAQCAFNRSSLLCGSCQPGLSLSLGSSRCLSCPSYWPALFVVITLAAVLAGIALVALLLVLNITVAVGTLNGLIFYANVVYTNKNILFPFQEMNFVSVLILWLNLEPGIDTCYYPGIDTYIKTWLQLAFPAYVILLVVFVIIISSYSSKFSNLIGKKDPVATLATLILLSYAKLLEVCFKSLSVGFLKYPDGSSETLWLPDATIGYFSVKHIILFLASAFILLIGLLYTAIIFVWQWLLYLPTWRIFKWTRNPKIQTFIETYHKPYTAKNRYWTGLLLIARIVLYLVSAVNVSNDPTIALTSIFVSMTCIVFLRLLTVSKTYRKWTVNVLETFFYVNILFFSTFTWYSLGKPHSNQLQEAAAYTSVMTTFTALLIITLGHVYAYTNAFSKLKETKLGRSIKQLFTDTDPNPNPRQCRCSPRPDDDIRRLDDLLDDLDGPVNTADYDIAPLLRGLTPTYSVVEVHKPRDLPRPNGEVANS